VRGLVAGGHTVTGLARTAAKREALAAAGAAAAAADLFDPASLRRALAGHDVVVNLATRIPAPSAVMRAGGWRENDRIRNEAGRNLAEAAAAEGVSRLIQEAVSFVYEDGGESWITERQPVRAGVFTASSLTATESAMSFADAYRFAVVLRFGLVYGDEPTTRWQLDRVRRGKPAVMGDPQGYLSPLSVEDAGSAVVAALAAPSGVYNVSGPPLTRAEWAAALGAAAGVEGPARFFSPLVVRLVRKKVEPLLRSQRVSSDAFHNATGWRARTAVPEGLAGLSPVRSRG
jgi:nucleoside-diphosphate-sugar epimerase